MLQTRNGVWRACASIGVIVGAVALVFAVEPSSQAEPAPAAPTTTILVEYGAELSPGAGDWTAVAALQEARRQDNLARWYTAAAENERRAAAAAQAAEAARAQAQAARVSAPRYSGNAAGTVNGYPCGGDLPPCWVLQRESGGNPLAENPTSSASGLWQFIDGTWAGFGGYSHASHAPVDVQNEKARLLWAGGAGCSHWNACGR